MQGYTLSDILCAVWLLLLIMLGNFACFLFSVDFFLKLTFSKKKKSFRNTIRVSNSLDPDQAWHFVEPDLGPNHLQKLSADDRSHHQWGKELNQIYISCFSITQIYFRRLFHHENTPIQIY